ncbi:MAG: extracellular solute-binding protein [Nitriliruptoraceae bacterium]|nr:extracellular solute-binding protein [Nitriliruptoraceae bacterium]
MRLFTRARTTVALTVAAALILAACGGETDEPDDGDSVAAEEPDDDSGDADADEAPDEPEEVPEGDIEVPVWIAFTDYRLDWARDVAASFSDQVDGYTITVQGYDNYEALFDATLLAVDQGGQPAIVQYFEAATTEARDAVSGSGEPLFASVEDRIAGRDEILGFPVILDDVVDAVQDYYTIDGEFSSMPWNSSSAIMFSNRTLMEELGISDIPETWQDLEAACETVMSADDAPSACVTWPNHGWFTEQQIALQGGLLANNDNGRADRADEVNLDGEEITDFIQWWADMNAAGFYTYSGTQRDWDGAYNAFASQQVPFVWYSSSDTTLLTEEGENGGFEVEASFLPFNADRPDGGALIGGATLWLTEGLESDVEDVALAFLQYFNNPENAADWHKVTGYIPITNASIALLEEEGWFDDNPNSAVASAQLDAAPDTPATAGVLMGNFVAIRDVVTEAIEDILVNDLDVAERLTQADATAQQLLEEYNLLVAN